MFKKLIAICVSLSMLLFAQEVGKISGTVADSRTGTQLAGANIIVEGSAFGSASDSDGSFLLLGIPVGTYTLRCDFIGYKSIKLSNITVSNNLTSHADFDLEVSAVEGEVIEIVAQKPLIVISATNAVRSVDAEEIGNFASRNIEDMITTQAGVVLVNGMLSIRGSRPDEVGFELEGATTKAVSVGGGIQTGRSANAVNAGGSFSLVTAIPEALQEISIQSGGYSADLGGANAGIIQTTLKTGGTELSGSVKLEGDNGDYGYNDATLTVGGPITDQIRFFVAGQKSSTDNWNPQFWSGAVINEGSPIPDLLSGLTPTGDSLTLTWDDKIEGRTQDEINLNGTILFDYNPWVFRVGGAYSSATRRLNSLPLYNMFNMDRLPQRNYNSNLLNLKTTYFLSKNTYFNLNLNSLSNKNETYDPNFAHETVADFLTWGDSTIVADKGLGTYLSEFTPPNRYNLAGFEFARPGAPTTGYYKNEQAYIGMNGGVVSQMGAHELKAGFDWKKWTVRSYGFNSGAIKSINQEIAQDVSGAVADNFAQENESAATSLRQSRIYNIGYDEFGRELDDGIDRARHPNNFSFYVNDKIEFNDLIVNAGLRVDNYNLDDFKLTDPLDPPYNQTSATADENGLVETDSYAVIQPRLGLAFPLSDKAVFHLQYGQFAQFPDLGQPYKARSSMALNWGGQNFIRDPLGFNLEPIHTTQYEVGYAYQIGTSGAVDVTVFTKNTTGQLVVELIEVDANASNGGSNYTVYNNGDFTTVNGVEMSFHTRRINNIMASASYTYSDARGTNSFPNSGIANMDYEDARPTMITPLRYENKHKGTVSLDYHADNQGGLLDGFGANLLFNFNSGHPFTLSTGGMGQRAADEGALLSDSDPRNRIPIESIGASSTPWIFNFDLKLDKAFNIGGISLNGYLYVTNLFNSKSVINVYNRTGNAYDDGFLSSPELSNTIVEGQGAVYEELYQAVNLDNRQHWIADHGFDIFGVPRQIKAGIQVNF